MRRWAIINALLGLVVALLALEIVRTWARGLPTVEVPARSAVAERPAKSKRNAAARGGTPAQQPPTAMVASIGERDLFDPSRRAQPTEEVKVEAPKESGPPPGLTVTGVRIFGKDREVFVTDASQGNAQRRLRVGDQIIGYTVKAIQAMGLTLTAPSGDAITMPLEVDKGKAPAAPRVPAGRGAQAASGMAAPSPAAGIQPPSPVVRPGQQVPGQAVQPQPVPAPGGRPAVPPPAAPGQSALQQMPAEVRQKLEQLKQQDATPRLGRKR